jgi:hypothetical protein
MESQILCVLILHDSASVISSVGVQNSDCQVVILKTAGAAFTNFFTIIPSTILLQANPDAPNSSKRGRIVEKLWKNCRKILRTLVRQAAGKNCGKIVERFCVPTSGRKIFLQFFHNFSPPPAGRRPANLSTIILQFFHNYSLLAVYPSKETKIPQQFCGKIVEEFGAFQIRGRIFLTAAD